MLNQARIDGLLKYMDQIGLSQMLIRNPVLVRYFVGITPRGADRATILYVSKKNGVKLILNELTNYPKELGVDQEFHGDQDNVAEVISRYTIHDEPLGFDGEYPAKWLLSLREFGAASDYVLGDRALNLQRAHKDAEEMELLREASRMNDRVRGVFHDGITEKEAAGIISRMFVEEGADMPGWVIAAFGPNAANVHHIPGDARLKEGDAILIDMGSPRKGYHSDMTRTFFWKSVGEKQRAVYELVKNANIAAEKAIRPGMKCSDVDKVARDLITEGGYGPYFTHRLGHYISTIPAILPGTIPIRWNPPWPSPVSRVSTCRASSACGWRTWSSSPRTAVRSSTATTRNWRSSACKPNKKAAPAGGFFYLEPKDTTSKCALPSALSPVTVMV